MQLQTVTTDEDSTIHFIDLLHQSVEGAIVLIWDGLPAHRSRKVVEHMDAQSWLTVERFPAYAPELNPVEYLWSAFKSKDLANLSPDTIEQLGKHVEQAYSRAENETQILQGFLEAAGLYNKITDST